MNNYLLECQNINKFYQEGENQTQVLKGVSFAMKPQELVAIVGEFWLRKKYFIAHFGWFRSAK